MNEYVIGFINIYIIENQVYMCFYLKFIAVK